MSDRYVPGTNYHMLDGLYGEIKEILAGSAMETEMMELGRSAEDNPIFGVCIGDGDFSKPELLYVGGVHPMEFIGPRTNLEVMRVVASQQPGGRLARMMDKVNVWFIPVLNPDGYIRVQRKLASPFGIAYHRTNARGVDLNRNFPVAFYKHNLALNPFAGSIIPASPYYHGAEPCCEPESRTLRDFVFGRNIKVFLDMHSFGNQIMYPYAYDDKKCRDEETFRIIGRELIRHQKTLKYRLMQSSRHYKMGGDICDWLYDEFRILAFLIELGGFGADLNDPKTVINPFYWANPVSPEGVIENTKDAIVYLIEVLYGMFV